MKKSLLVLSTLLVLFGSGCVREPQAPYSDGSTKSEYVAIYKKDCDLNDGRGCASLAVLYWHGRGVKKDHTKAELYFTKACELNNGNGCARAGQFFDYGSTMKKDLSKAIGYYHKACDLNNGIGCHMLASCYKSGHGVKKDDEKSKMYYRKACKYGVMDDCWYVKFLPLP